QELGHGQQGSCHSWVSPGSTGPQKRHRSRWVKVMCSPSEAATTYTVREGCRDAPHHRPPRCSSNSTRSRATATTPSRMVARWRRGPRRAPTGGSDPAEEPDGAIAMCVSVYWSPNGHVYLMKPVRDEGGAASSVTYSAPRQISSPSSHGSEESFAVSRAYPHSVVPLTLWVWKGRSSTGSPLPVSGSKYRKIVALPCGFEAPIACA